MNLNLHAHEDSLPISRRPIEQDAVPGPHFEGEHNICWSSEDSRGLRRPATHTGLEYGPIRSTEFDVNHGGSVLSLLREICLSADTPSETVFGLVVQDGDSVGVGETRKEKDPLYPEIVGEAFS